MILTRYMSCALLRDHALYLHFMIITNFLTNFVRHKIIKYLYKQRPWNISIWTVLYFDYCLKRNDYESYSNIFDVLFTLIKPAIFVWESHELLIFYFFHGAIEERLECNSTIVMVYSLQGEDFNIANSTLNGLIKFGKEVQLW